MALSIWLLVLNALWFVLNLIIKKDNEKKLLLIQEEKDKAKNHIIEENGESEK